VPIKSKAKPDGLALSVTPRKPDLSPTADVLRKEEPCSATVSPSILFSDDDAEAAKARADIQAMMRELETKSAVQASRKAELAASRRREVEDRIRSDANRAALRSTVVTSAEMDAARILEEQRKTAEMENTRQDQLLQKQEELRKEREAVRKAAEETRDQAKRDKAARIVAEAEASLRTALAKQEDLARREEDLRLREEQIARQEANLRSLIEKKEREQASAQKRARESASEAGLQHRPDFRFEPLAQSVLDWLQSIEPETSDLLKRLARQHADHKTSQQTKSWIDDTSELLSMWLQTGDMFRQLIRSRVEMTDKRNASNQQDQEKGNAHLIEDNDASCTARVHESVLAERCQQVCELLSHRNEHTASLLLSLNDLVRLTENVSRMDAFLSKSSTFAHGMTSFAAQLEYELVTVSRERAELEEVCYLEPSRMLWAMLPIRAYLE
jgi:hypothetical protein